MQANSLSAKVIDIDSHYYSCVKKIFPCSCYWNLSNAATLYTLHSTYFTKLCEAGFCTLKC